MTNRSGCDRFGFRRQFPGPAVDPANKNKLVSFNDDPSSPNGHISLISNLPMPERA